MSQTKTCSECGATHSASQQSGNYLDYGWSFNFLSLGHYGGFTDCIPDTDKTEDDYVIHLCHDCCLKMIEALPNSFKAHLGNLGCHPGDLEKESCCQYAWTWDKANPKNSYRGDEHGGWYLVFEEADEDVPLSNG